MLEMADMCIQKAKADDMSPALVNVQDKFGGACLLQVIMMNRIDLLTFLCTKQRADPRIADNDGAVPTRMVEILPGLRNIILPSANKLAANEFRRTHKSELECHCCGKSVVEKLLNCSRCKNVYCMRYILSSHTIGENKTENVFNFLESYVLFLLYCSVSPFCSPTLSVSVSFLHINNHRHSLSLILLFLSLSILEVSLSFLLSFFASVICMCLNLSQPFFLYLTFSLL